MSYSRVLRQEEAASNNNGSCQGRAAPVNVNHQDHEGNSALSLACRRGQRWVVLRLLKKGTGVDIGLTNVEGITPYIEATSNEHTSIAFELLKHDPFKALGWLSSTAPILSRNCNDDAGGRRRCPPKKHKETTSRKKQRLVVPDVEEQQSKRRKKQKRN